MQIRGLTEQQLETAATDVGVCLVNVRRAGRGFAFTLGLTGELWRRRGHSGRKVAAVCYHGHAAFMQRVFDANPEAVIISAMSRFDGVRDFQNRACLIGERNIGSLMRPLEYNAACDCEGALREARV